VNALNSKFIVGGILFTLKIHLNV